MKRRLTLILLALMAFSFLPDLVQSQDNLKYINYLMVGKKPWIDVTHPTYGATGDGVTDDTDALKAAIAYGISVGGAILYVPTGTYLFDEDLRLNASDTGQASVLLVGNGPTLSKLKWNKAGDPTVAGVYIHALEGSPIRAPAGLRNIGIDMNGYSNAALLTSVNEFFTIEKAKFGNFTDKGLEIGRGAGSAYNNSSHFIASDLQIVPHSTGANYGLVLDGTQRALIQRVTFDTQNPTALDTAVYINGDQNHLVNIVAEDCGRAVHIAGGRGTIIEDLNSINPTAAKVSRTFDGITGTFNITVAAGVSSYTIISARDPNSYSHQADYFLRDAEKGVTVPTRAALGGLYQSIESFPYGSVVVDGNNGYLEINGSANGGDNDDLDVNGIGLISVNMSQGDVVIGGLKNGVQGQIIHIVKSGSSNTFTLENQEGVGTQDIIIGNGQDLFFTKYGGAVLRCGEDGGAFYAVSQEGGYLNIPNLADEATPSVKGTNIMKTGGTTTITDFDDGVEGQILTVLCKHSLTFDFTTAQDADHNLDGSSADITADTGDILQFLSEEGTTWHLISNLDASVDNN